MDPPTTFAELGAQIYAHNGSLLLGIKDRRTERVLLNPSAELLNRPVLIFVCGISKARCLNAVCAAEAAVLAGDVSVQPCAAACYCLLLLSCCDGLPRLQDVPTSLTCVFHVVAVRDACMFVVHASASFQRTTGGQVAGQSMLPTSVIP